MAGSILGRPATQCRVAEAETKRTMDSRGVDSAPLGRRLALIVNEADLARRRRTGIRLVEQRGHGLIRP